MLSQFVHPHDLCLKLIDYLFTKLGIGGLQ